MKTRLYRDGFERMKAFSLLSKFALPAFAFGLMPVFAALFPVETAMAQTGRVIEEVIVTARKKDESVQEIPVVVNVITSDAIESQRIEGIKDLGTIVPGLVTSRTSASTAGAIYLRGVGTGSLSPLFDQAVAINFDGVGTSSAQLLNAGMFDLQRIEVLRGPQALFYGKNSPGGVIAIHTNDPSMEFEAQLSAMYELEREEQGLRAVVSGPLSDRLGARLSLGWSEADSHGFDVYNFDAFETGPAAQSVQTAYATGKDPVASEKSYAMGTLVWDPLDTLAVKLKYAHLEDYQDGHANLNYQRTQCGMGSPQTLYPVPGIDNCKMDEKVIAPGIDPDLVVAHVRNSDHRGNGFADNVDDFVALITDYEISESLALTSVTGYYQNDNLRLSDASFQVASGLSNSSVTQLEQWSQELRLTSSFTGAVNFTVGAFYEDKKIYDENDVVGSSNLVLGPETVLLLGKMAIAIGRQTVWQESTAYSAFAQVDLDFADQWTLSAGARYSYEEKQAKFLVDNISVGVGGTQRAEIDLKEDNPEWHNVSPDVTLRYQFSDDIMFFLSYKTGFKSGGFDASFNTLPLYLQQTTTDEPYDNIYNEESVVGFEAGVKSMLFDGSFRLNVTAYSYAYDDLQLSFFDTGPAGVPSLKAINAASASLEGLEIESFWLTPIDNLSLTVNVALASSTYDEYIADCYTGQTVAMGCDQNRDPDSGNFTGADMSGESLRNASDVSATIAVDYMLPLSEGWNLGMNASSSYKSDYNPTPSLYPEDWQQDGYWWTNASISLFSSDDQWEFYFRAVNLTEEYYSATGADAPFSGNPDNTGTGDPSGLPDFFQYVEGGRQFTLGMTVRL